MNDRLLAINRFLETPVGPGPRLLLVLALLALVPTYVTPLYRMTMFAPLFRVERVFLDEPAGTIRSFSQRFQDVVGRSIHEYLGL